MIEAVVIMCDQSTVCERKEFKDNLIIMFGVNIIILIIFNSDGNVDEQTVLGPFKRNWDISQKVNSFFL